MFLPVYKRLLEIFVILLAVCASAYIGYNCGIKNSPRVQCSFQVERELISNPAFRSYVTRLYGHTFKTREKNQSVS